MSDDPKTPNPEASKPVADEDLEDVTGGFYPNQPTLPNNAPVTQTNQL
jgi:hypothetical protein